MIRIVLVDDHPIVRDGIKNIIDSENDLLVVGIANNGVEALKIINDTKPDIVLTDISMPEMNGIELTQKIVDNIDLPNTKVIVLTMHDSHSYVNSALESGAKGFLLKDSESTEIIKSIKEVFAGKKYVSKTVSQILVSDMLNTKKEIADENKLEISKREKEVLLLIAEGLSNKEIATKLFLSTRTVDAHRYNIMQKLEARNTAELIKIAVKHKLIDY
ncbi:MAG: response regulator transcription factor [Bacteroidota bacterium]